MHSPCQGRSPHSRDDGGAKEVRLIEGHFGDRVLSGIVTPGWIEVIDEQGVPLDRSQERELQQLSMCFHPFF